MKEMLRALDFGNSVAEFDKSLEKYFVENDAFDQLVNNKVDIIAGDKGTGKTALFQILQKRYASIKELKGIEILAGFNPAGNPIFQRLVHEQVLTEGQYASVWKAYVLALAGNWALDIAGADHSDSFQRLSILLTETGLLSKDDKPDTIFSKIVNAIQRVFLPTSAAVEFTFSETGVPIVTPKLEFGKREADRAVKEVRHEEALGLLNKCLGELGFSLWIVLDRLDEAFQGFPAVEMPALRALFRTYLDLLAFPNVSLKLFVRRDLLRRIIGNGFVNLTHINARKVEITWDEQDLMYLLCLRVRDNKRLMEKFEAEQKIKGAATITDEELFYRIFPRKVDQAERKPTTYTWMMGRIRDGGGVKPPRNLIGLAMMAKDEQLRVETRAPRAYALDLPLICSESIRKALEKLSVQRVEDTLLAEAGAEISAMVQKFRRSKSEHSVETIQATLGLAGASLNAAILQLVQIGFLEEVKTSWKIPMLYRDGLEITQGKAFQNNSPADVDDGDDA